MIISDLNHVEAAQTKLVVGAGDSFAFLSQLALSQAISGGGKNNIASPATALSLNLAPVTQAPVL